MSTIINPWELSAELESQSSPLSKIPNFTLAKYMVLRLVPPKGKTVRDGLVMTAAMLSYTPVEGDEVKTINISEGTGGYEIEFPLGKVGLMATKFRGPTSYYKFVDPRDKKFKQISNDKFTLDGAIAELSKTAGWEELSDVEKDISLDEYFINNYNFGMDRDFALDVDEHVEIGLVSQFYRRYAPPAEGEKYPHIIITKWPSKRNPEEAGFANLTGEFKKADEEVALAIYDKLTERNDNKFDPSSFSENNDDDVI